LARANAYNTRQGEAILSFISALGDTEITAEQIAAHLAKSNVSIGMTTIYRHLEKLEKAGNVRKVIVDGSPSAYYRFVGQPQAGSLRMKCEGCGKLFVLSCDEADEFESHLKSEHNFRLDPLKTVFYGTCGDCIKNDKGEKEYAL